MSATFARWNAFRVNGRKLLMLAYLLRGSSKVHLASSGFRITASSVDGVPGRDFITLRSHVVCALCRQLNRAPIVEFHISAPTFKKQIKPKKPKLYPPKGGKKPKTIIEVWKNMTVTQLANALQKDLDHMFEAMLFVENAVYYDTPESVIDSIKVISAIVKRSGVRCTWISNPAEEPIARTNKDVVRSAPPEAESLVNRPPVVTVMGHVDHGKTTLLDSLRHTSVVSHEFGGITQHIGAFLLSLPTGGTVTFLDTPGHAAFMAMRARGARVTDIIVLVVAADDGVMEQTVECIRLANQAHVPIIVAINKMDKPQANIELCKKGLLQHGIQLEDAGGDIQAVPISALEGTNLDMLIETIVTQAEVMQLKADPSGLVEGYIVESRSDPFRGKLSTLIVQRGTLKKGACLVAGTAWAKVKAMFDDKGQPMNSAPPSTPVEVGGWKDLASAGDEFLEVESEKRAHEVVLYRLQMEKDKKMDSDREVVQTKAVEHFIAYREELVQRRALGFVKKKRLGPREKEIKEDGLPRLAVVVKGDVDGSVEAILDVLVTYHSEQCPMDIVHFGVGMVCDNDVELCDAFNGIVYSFNVDTLPSAKNLAKSAGVPIKQFNVIYRLVNDIREEINSRLPLLDEEQILGEASVLQEFIINDGRNKIPVAGCRCISGSLKKSALFRIIQNQKIVHEGTLSSMRHLKDEVDSIKKDVECGLKMTDDQVRFQPGDRIVCFKKIKVAQKTNWNPGF